MTPRHRCAPRRGPSAARAGRSPRSSMTRASDVLLEVRGLDFSYGQVQVLFGVDVDVHRGETLALLGTNGAGKSTLLKNVSGLVLPDRGTVRFGGRDVTREQAEARVRMGVVQVP